MAPLGEPRRFRAAVAMAAACIVLIASAVAYLHPLPPFGRPMSPTAPGSTAVPRPAAILTWISFGDADHGAVALVRPPGSSPSATTSWVTADGGRTWQSFTALGSTSSAIIFDSPRHAVAEPSAPGSSMVTDDGGRTWRPLPLPGRGWLTFLDADRGWLLQTLGEPLATGPHLVALWRTSDDGATWQRLSALGVPDAGTKGPLSFADVEHGVMVVGTSGDAFLSLLTTADGGISWQPVATFGSPLPGAYLLDTQLFLRGARLLAVPFWVTGAAVDARGAVLGTDAVIHPSVSVSDDAGRTWSPLRSGPTAGNASKGIVGPTLDDRGRLVVFDRGRLWVSEDSGTTWRAHAAALPRGMEAVGPITAASGALFVAARADRLAPTNELLRSRDGGSHWSVVPLPKLPA